MIDKTMVIASVVAVAGRLIAQANDVTAELPGVGAIANLTSTGAMLWLVVWLITRGIPSINEKNNETVRAIVKDFREESALLRADREKDRERTKCEFDPARVKP